MTVLITGAAGFIGYHVARRLLERGEDVVGIDNVNDYYSVSLKRDRLEALRRDHGSAFTFVEVDFADDAALAASLQPLDFDRIVHLGAQAGVRYSIEHPRAYVKANLVGHLNLLEVGRERSAAHLVYASSSSVYGGNDSLPFRVEDRVDHPLSLYAATKKADELMSETYAHLYRLPQTGLRFFTVYGPWGRPDMAMWLFTEAMQQGRPIRLFNHGRMRRDFTFVDDIVAGVLAALDHPPAAPAHRLYNIGNSRQEQLGTLVATLERLLGVTAAKELLPMQPGDVPATYADVSAMRRDFGWAPTTRLADGLARWVAWWQAHRA